LLDEQVRGDAYLEAMSEGGLAGFFCVHAENGTAEIGLGLRPDLCRKGLGSA